MDEVSPLAFRRHARLALQSLMAFGANLAVASALGGLAASALWAETTFSVGAWFDIARGVVGAVLVLAAGVWAYLASMLFVTQLNLGSKIPGRKRFVRLLEVLILVTTVPVAVAPFGMVANARMVSACDQWWSGEIRMVMNPHRCAVLSEGRGVIRHVPSIPQPAIN